MEKIPHSVTVLSLIHISFLYSFLRLIVVWGPPTETAYKKTVGLAAVLLCASNRGRSQTAVLKLIIDRKSVV